MYLDLTAREMRLLVTNWESNNISIIDTNTQRVKDTISGVRAPSQIRIARNQSKAYLPLGDDAVGIIDTDRKTAAEIKTNGPGPQFGIDSRWFHAWDRRGSRRPEANEYTNERNRTRQLGSGPDAIGDDA